MIEESKLCGANFEKTASPFNRILCLGYYDGPTSGLAKCAESQKAYRFELVAWDSGFENRIYSLAETDVKVFDSVVHTLARLEEPRWPFWTPRWQFGSSLEESRTSSEIDQALSTIPAASLLIATDHLDESILACRALGTAVGSRMPKEGTLPDSKDWAFWREYLGLPSRSESPH
jgi:hypothetical protein